MKAPIHSKVLSAVCSIIYIIMMILIIMSILTSQKKLKKYAREYVNNVEINDTYNKAFEKYNFPEKATDELLHSKTMKEVMTNSIYDLLNSFLYNPDHYIYSYSDYNRLLNKEISDISAKYNIILGTTNTANIINSVMDVCGISNMYMKNTIEEYKVLIFEKNGVSFIEYKDIFEFISEVRKVKYIIALLIMFIITWSILIITSQKVKQLPIILYNTTVTPSLIMVALTLYQATRTDIPAIIKIQSIDALIISIVVFILSIIPATAYILIRNKIIDKKI